MLFTAADGIGGDEIVQGTGNREIEIEASYLGIEINFCRLSSVF